MNNRLKCFLLELSELTNKYEIAIGGCGCCGSPYIIDFKKQYQGDNLEFDVKQQKYILENKEY